MIIKRYIYRELLVKLLWVMGLLILVLASNRLVGFLADAAEGALPSSMVFQMLGIKMLSSLPKLLPIALFIAVLLGFSRLVRDKELVVLSAAGVNRGFQVFLVLRFAAIYTIIAFAIIFFIAPWAEQNLHILKERAKQESDITGISSGKFKEFNEGERVLYTEGVTNDGKAAKEVFLQVKQEGKLGVLKSDSARFITEPKSGNRFILFEDGQRYVGSPGDQNYQITNYSGYAILVELAEIQSVANRIDAVPTTTLIKSSLPLHQAELQWRVSLVLACLLLPILAVAISYYIQADKRFVPIIIAIMIYIVYSNLLSIAQTFIKREVISVYIGIWWVHLLLIVGIILIYFFPWWRLQRKTLEDLQVLPPE